MFRFTNGLVIGLLAITGMSVSAVAQERITRKESSAYFFSGHGKDFGGWARFTTQPAPSGYVLESFSYELAGDDGRWCHSWGECRLVGRDDAAGTVTVEFRTQGHDEFPFLINTSKSRIIVTAVYRKK